MGELRKWTMTTLSCDAIIILYCMVACLIPFVLSSAYMILEAHLEKNGVPLGATRPTVASSFEMVIYLFMANMFVSCAYFIFRSFGNVKSALLRLLVCAMTLAVFLVVYYCVYMASMMLLAFFLSTIYGLVPFSQ